jgi:lipoyl-dependent peroxiredoxin
MKRSATAIWQGSLSEGNGVLTSESYVLNSALFSSKARARMEDGNSGRTGPEKLIAAAHADCLSMALSGVFHDAGYKPEKLKVSAEVTLDNILVQGWTITSSHLVLVAKVPGINTKTVRAIAAQVKANYPVSRALKANVTLDASLL